MIIHTLLKKIPRHLVSLPLSAWLASVVWAGVLLVPRAQADDAFAVQFKPGLSTLTINGGTNYTGSGGLGLELRPQVNYEMDSIKSAVGLFYEGHIGSNIGAFPISRIGLAGYYYLFGLPLSAKYLENGVTFSESHMAPFITGQLTFASVSLSDTLTNPQKPTSFNGEALGYMLGGGVEVPMGSSTCLIVEVLLEGTLAGGQSGSGGTVSGNGLSFNSFGGFLGFSLHP